MSRVVALLALPMDADDVARVLAGLARAYPGAVLGDSDDPRVLVVEDPYDDENGLLVLRPGDLVERVGLDEAA